jgi:glycosyltransferase involved in cell wall biosynthesis
MKRILLLTRPICPPWDEGSKNFAYTLAKYASGFEVHLLTCAKSGSFASNWKRNFQKNVVCHDIYSSPKLDFRQKYRLFKFLRKADGFDVIHSLFTPTMINSFFLKRALKNKKMKLIQTVATLREDLYKKHDFKKILFGDLIVAYSDYAKEKLEKIGFKNVRRIYPGIDVNLFSPAPKNPVLMKKFETGDGDFVINYTGEYVRLGDMDDIIGAFVDLTKQNSNFKLHLAVRVKNEKDVAKKREVSKSLKKANVLDRVAFIDDGSYTMEQIYNLADISIFPARTMAGKFDIPLAVIEAMSCGKPVIASNLERLKYFLNENNSILINPGDHDALKEKILYLYENADAREKLGKAGQEYVRENFDIMKVVKEYERIYEKL